MSARPIPIVAAALNRPCEECSYARTAIVESIDSPPHFSNRSLLALSASFRGRVSSRANSQVESTSEMCVRDRSLQIIVRWISSRDQTTRFLEQADASRNVPFPASNQQTTQLQRVLPEDTSIHPPTICQIRPWQRSKGLV